VAGLLAQFLELDEVKASGQHRVAIDQVTALSKSNNLSGLDFPFLRLWSILCDVAKVVREFTLIVDGLDECDEECRNDLCLELIKLASEPNARIILLFRPTSALQRVFDESFKIEITPNLIRQDIQLYVTKETRKHPRLTRHQEKIIDKVPQWCNGIFLLAKLMLDCLKHAATYTKQLEYLATCPPGISQFYEELLSRRTAQLTDDRLQRRREIFLILLKILTSPTCEELSVILALRDGTSQLDEDDKLIDPEEEILQLCCPLVHISKGHVSLMHESVREFLVQPGSGTSFSVHMTFDASDAFLARKCLLALSQDEYQSPNKISILIRRNVAAAADEDEDKYFYQYAATHWFIHLFALLEPAVSLIELAARFLGGNEFVSWSEFIFQLSGSQGTMLEVEGKLKVWTSSLSPDIRDYLLQVVENYFTGPYRSIAKVFEEEGGDKELPYLCLFQLGAFYNLSARLEEAFEVKKSVAEGLVGLLGERHPLSLMAESAYALEFLGQGRMREAEETFGRLAQIQREVIGPDRPDCFQSLQRQGMAELWMTKYAEADLNLTASLDGFIKTGVGVGSFLYLLSQQTLGCVLEGQGEIKRATLDFEHVWRYRVSILGPDNPMAIWSRCAMVSTYRKTGRYDEAETAVNEVIESRKRALGSEASPTVDAVIQKIVLFRETGKADEALELIDFISGEGLAKPWFERVCQVDHIRALLEIDAGKFESPRKILQALVDQALDKGLEGRNRSMLWVRLDLATILRNHDREDEALMLFDDLVTSKGSESSSSWEVPQAPNELVIAEKALQLVRKIRVQQAEDLLEKNGLRWVRQEDFWMLAGGPAADTGWMKAP
jgi:tetratricopeptide (TPR) repeat protein